MVTPRRKSRVFISEFHSRKIVIPVHYLDSPGVTLVSLKMEKLSLPSESISPTLEVSSDVSYEKYGRARTIDGKYQINLADHITPTTEDRWLKWVIRKLEFQGGNNSKPSANNSSNEGTIYNNFYLQTYNGSLDFSGHVSGSDKGPSSAVGELVSSVGSLAGTLLLDQNTEETTNLSDRINTQTLAMTAVNTQSSVGILQAYSTPADEDSPTSCSDVPSAATPATERYFTFPLATWGTTQAAFQYVTFTPFKRLWEDENLYSATAKRHFLHKNGWSVQVQCNASQFHSGSLLVFMAPEFLKAKINRGTSGQLIQYQDPGKDLTDWTTPEDSSFLDIGSAGQRQPVGEFAQNPFQWSLYPHQILNLRTGTSVSIDVPFLNPAPSSAVGVHTTWTLVVAVLTPLKVSSSVVNSLDITVSVAPLKPVWNGIHHKALENEAPIPSAPRENKGMFVTTIPDVTTPVYAKCVNPDISCLKGEITDFLQIAQIPTFINNNNVPFFTCTNTADRESAVFSMNVIPSDTKILNTAFGHTATLFTQYSGSLVVSFIFTGAAMVRGKFLIAYTPPGGGKPLTLSQAKQSIYSIWDLGLNSTYRFNIPFISPTNYRWTYSGVGSVLDIDGWLTVFQLTPLTYPADTPTNSDIVVSVAAGPDFTFRNPVQAFMTQTTDNAETGDPEQPGPSADFVAHPVNVPNLSQSALSFFFDRAWYWRALAARKPGTSSLAEKYNVFLLDPHFTEGKNVMLRRVDTEQSFLFGFLNASPFTYFRADLEITIIPLDAFEDQWEVHWFPSGASLPLSSIKTSGRTELSMSFMGLPTMVQRGHKKMISFTIPWNSPLSALCNYFDGKNNYSSTADSNYGQVPGNNWGAIVITSKEEKWFKIYGRFKNARAWAPRPYRTLQIPAPQRSGRVRPPVTDANPPNQNQTGQSLDLDRYVIHGRDTSLDGDVEENPGPFQFQGPKKDSGPSLAEAIIKDFLANTPDVTSEEKKKLGDVLRRSADYEKKHRVRRCKQEQDVEDDMSAFRAFLEADDPIQTAIEGWNTLREIQDAWKRAKSLLADSEFWYNIITMLVKIVVTTAIYHHSPDMTTFFLLSLLSVVDMINVTSIKDMIIERFRPYISTPPPPIDIEEEETFFQKMKRVFKCEAPTDTAKDANNWFSLFKNIEWALKLVSKLKDWVTAWFAKSPNPKETLAEEMKSFAVHAAAISDYRQTGGNYPTQHAEYMQRIFDLASNTSQIHVANLASKFLVKRSNNKPRTEPVVVVLRGKPGAGKSVASQVLAQAVSKIMHGSQSVYSFPPDSDHFDGYSGQYSVIMDDLGQNPDGEDFATFCQMVSTTNFLPSMASLEDKGMPFSSNFIVATTNHARFNPPTVSDIRAVERRIFLDLNVKPGSECSAGDALDLEAALSPIGPAIGPFSQDCELLHTSGLTFTVASTGTELSLLEVLDLVVQKIKDKNSTQNKLGKLVFEAPSPQPDFANMSPTEYALTMMTMQTNEIAALRAEISQLNQDNEIFQEEKRMMFRAFYSFAAFCLAIYSSHKIIGSVRHYFEHLSREQTKEEVITEIKKLAPAQIVGAPLDPNKVEHFLDTPPIQAPYDGVRKIVKPVEKILEVQAPGMEFENAVYMHATSRFDFHMPGEKHPRTQTCLLLCSRIILLNHHTWTMDFETFEVRGETFNKTDCQFVHLTSGDIPTDAVAVQLPKGPQFRNNISKFISVYDNFPVRNSQVIGINADGPLYFSGSMVRPPAIQEISTGITSKFFVYKAITQPGYCGSPIIGFVAGAKKILGFHSAGACGLAGAVAITKENAEMIVDYFKATTQMKPEGALTPLEPGTRVFTPRVSTLRKSLAYPKFKPAAGPAVLSSKDKRLDDGVDFDKMLFSKHTKDQIEYPPEFTEMAHWYSNRLVTYLGKDNSLLTEKEAILGIVNLDPMDKNTSPGLPYTLNSKRRTALIDFEEGKIVDPQCRQRYNQIVSGDYSEQLFQTFLKDEIRPIEKIRAGKTRVVDVPSLEHVVWGRQLLGRFCSKFHFFPGIETGSAIGCDPDWHWSYFAAQLSRKKNVYDVDYSSFDATHGSGMFKLVAETVFSPENGFDPRLKEYLMSLAHSTHAFGAERFKIDGGLPSGCSATSVLNTVFNNIVVRAALKMTYSNFDPDDVLVLAYGDDLLVASNYQIDFNLVKKKLEESTLYKMTTANKQPDFPLTSSLLDVQFLKRRFVPFHTSSFIFRPVMDVKNLETILSFYHLNHLDEKIETVARLAFHCGYAEYERLFAPFREAGIHVPSWWVLQREWERKFW
nr:MAG: polyprotein [Jingmen bat picornavirus 4]